VIESETNSESSVDVSPLCAVLTWVRNQIRDSPPSLDASEEDDDKEKDEEYKKMLTAVDAKGISPLHYLAYHENIYEILDKLLGGESGNSMFLSCTELVERLEKQKFSSNTLTKAWIDQQEIKKLFNQAVSLSALKGKLLFVQLFQSLGIDINGQNENDETALHAAAAGGHIDIATYLLKHGAYVDASYFTSQSQNWVPICDAVLHGKTAAVEFLLNKNAEFTRKCKKKSRFGISQLNMNSIAAVSGSIPILEMLLQRGLPLEKVAIYWACYGGHIDMLKHLLEKNLSLNERNQYDVNKTTLHVAIERGNFALAEFVATQSVKLINEIDKNGNTPLHYCAFISASTSKHKSQAVANGVTTNFSDRQVKPFVELLVGKGADLTLQNNKGKTAKELFDSPDLAKVLETISEQNINMESQLIDLVRKLQQRVDALEGIVKKQGEIIEQQSSKLEEQSKKIISPMSSPKRKQVTFADILTHVQEYEVIEEVEEEEEEEEDDEE
jgi:ankyrin repeat protein